MNEVDVMKAKKYIYRAVVGLGCMSLIVGAAALLASTPSQALTLRQGIESAQGTGVSSTLFGGTGVVTTAVNYLLFAVGALSVIMLIVGGIRYTVSGGNATAVTAAKNTVLYAIVGLIIALLAYAAINFIFNTLTTPGALDGTSGNLGGGSNGVSPSNR